MFGFNFGGSFTKASQIAFFVIAFLSVSAAMIAGHTWRFPDAIMVMIDHRFYFAQFRYFAINLILAGLAFRFIAYLGDLCTGRIRKDNGPSTLQNIIRFFFLSLGAIFGAGVFTHRYLNLSYTEFGSFALIVGFLCFVILIAFLKLLREVKEVHGESPTIGQVFREALASLWAKTAVILMLVASFTLGELHLSNMCVSSTARWTASDVSVVVDGRNFSVAYPTQDAEIVRNIGPTANGVLFCDYTGSRLKNRKNMLFTYVSDGRVGSIQASRETAFLPLVGIGWVIKRLDGLFGIERVL